MRKQILVVGPLPPPLTGVSVAIEQLLVHSRWDDYLLHHLDTTRKQIEPTGRIRLEKVVTDVRYILAVLWKLLRTSAPVLYFPISQNRLGVLRDSFVAVAASLLGRRVIAHVHGGHFRAMYDGLGRIERRLVDVALRRLDTAIVLGESLRPMFDGILPPNRVAVVHNGVPDAIPEEDLERAIAARSASRVLRIVFLSNLIESKGFGDLILAGARLRDAGVSFEMTFAGAWESDAVARRTRRLVADLGLDDHCRFVGVVAGEAKWATLLGASVFVLPSRYPLEGQPIAILEAMAAALPVVSTARGCIPEMVQDGVNGYIVPEGDVETLADRLRRFADQPGLVVSMGAESRRRYLSAYTDRHYLAGLRSVFDAAFEQVGGLGGGAAGGGGARAGAPLAAPRRAE